MHHCSDLLLLYTRQIIDGIYIRAAIGFSGQLLNGPMLYSGLACFASCCKAFYVRLTSSVSLWWSCGWNLLLIKLGEE